MALLKTVKTQFGIDATYWNIFSIAEDFKNKSIEVVVVGYASKEIRLADNEPVAWQNLQFNGDEYIKDATRTEIYEKLKTTDFIDAQDA
jgi:hypothetical protein